MKKLQWSFDSEAENEKIYKISKRKLLLFFGGTNFHFLNNRRVGMRVSIPLCSEATGFGTPSYFHGSSHMHWT